MLRPRKRTENECGRSAKLWRVQERVFHGVDHPIDARTSLLHKSKVVEKSHDPRVPAVLRVPKRFQGHRTRERPRALDFYPVVEEANNDRCAGQRVIPVTNSIDEGLPDCDGRELWDLLSNEAANHRVTPHLVVDGSICCLDKLAQRPGELAFIPEGSLTVHRPRVSSDLNAHTSPVALRFDTEHEQRSKTCTAVLGQEPQSTSIVGSIGTRRAKALAQISVEFVGPEVCDARAIHRTVLSRFNSALDDEPGELLANEGPVCRAGSHQQASVAGLHPATVESLDRDERNGATLDVDGAHVRVERRLRGTRGLLNPLVLLLPPPDSNDLPGAAFVDSADDGPTTSRVRECDQWLLELPGLRDALFEFDARRFVGAELGPELSFCPAHRITVRRVHRGHLSASNAHKPLLFH